MNIPPPSTRRFSPRPPSQSSSVVHFDDENDMPSTQSRVQAMHHYAAASSRGKFPSQTTSGSSMNNFNSYNNSAMNGNYGDQRGNSDSIISQQFSERGGGGRTMPPFNNNSNNYPPHNGKNANRNRNNVTGNNGNNTRKRAAKRRVKHDLPGPAGVWFRQQKQKTVALSAKKQSLETKELKHNHSSTTNKLNPGGGNSGTTSANPLAVDEINSQKERSDPDQDISPNKSNNDMQHHAPDSKKERQQHLFHDHSSDLHECNAWNLMCSTLDRIVPPPNNHLLLSHNNNSSQSYKQILRHHIPSNFALIHEIHEGRYDKNHLTPALYSMDLTIPLLVGYVASVQCHAHSDWTALLVDEVYGVTSAKGSGGGVGNYRGNSGGRGIVCWLEERFVKQHAAWVRPGAVWMMEGAKLALFPSSIEEDDEDDDNEQAESDLSTAETNGRILTDTSPSTENARSGANIDRMILIGESSMVYAWTPEEAASHLSNEEFIDLMKRRCESELPDEIIEVDEGDELSTEILEADEGHEVDRHVCEPADTPKERIKSLRKSNSLNNSGSIQSPEHDIFTRVDEIADVAPGSPMHRANTTTTMLPSSSEKNGHTNSVPTKTLDSSRQKTNQANAPLSSNPYNGNKSSATNAENAHFDHQQENISAHTVTPTPKRPTSTDASGFQGGAKTHSFNGTSQYVVKQNSPVQKGANPKSAHENASNTQAPVPEHDLANTEFNENGNKDIASFIDLIESTGKNECIPSEEKATPINAVCAPPTKNDSSLIHNNTSPIVHSKPCATINTKTSEVTNPLPHCQMNNSLPSESKEKLQYLHSATLCVGTSDSFDDMLDENDDELLQIATTGKSSNLSSHKAHPPSHKAHPLQDEKAGESNHCRNGKFGTPHLQEQTTSIHVGTGSSFDDMLDEDIDDASMVVKAIAVGAKDEKQSTAMNIGDLNVNIADPLPSLDDVENGDAPSCAKKLPHINIPAVGSIKETTCGGSVLPSLFDSLGTEDITDFLGEEDDDF